MFYNKCFYKVENIKNGFFIFYIFSFFLGIILFIKLK